MNCDPHSHEITLPRSDVKQSGDLFTVGTSVLLTTRYDVEPDWRCLKDIAIRSTQQQQIGTAQIQGNEFQCQVTVSFGGMAISSASAVESARLALRIARRRHAFQHAMIDVKGAIVDDDSGFIDDGLEKTSDIRWSGIVNNLWRGTGPRAATMERLYHDPLLVPWNFLPRPREILIPLRCTMQERVRQSQRALKVLDLGCGYGANAVLLEGDGAEVFGVDISPTAIRRCRQLVDHPQRFVVGNVTELPFANCFFDIVLDVGCLHCLTDMERRAAVLEIGRVMAPTGAVFSRIYKPQGRSWLDRQPFYVTSFGLDLTEVRNALKDRFELTMIIDSDDLTCCIGHPRVPQ